MVNSISPLIKLNRRSRWMSRAGQIGLAGATLALLMRVVILPQQQTQPQILPVTAQVQIKGQRIELEVAETPEQLERGLMHRPELASDRGMLFRFDTARPLKFWMKDTLIPLDIVFLLDGKVRQIASAVPCRANPCPVYDSKLNANEVIELPAGTVQKLGIKVGDRLRVQTLK
ncbi:DUF192 domain-containing protein [Phormidesmis sp. 146-35]